MDTTLPIWLLIAGFALLIAGPAIGWFAAVWRMQQREEELEERERRIRLKVLEMQRSTFQDSTTRIHGERGREMPVEDGPPAVDPALMTSVREQLAQAELERASLEEEHEIERTILQEELRAAREEIDRIRNTPASYRDVPESDLSEIRFAETVPTPDPEPEPEPSPERMPEPEPAPEPELDPEPDDFFDFHWTGPLPTPSPARVPAPPGPPAETVMPGRPEPPRRPEPPKRPAFKPVSDLVEPEHAIGGVPPLQRLLRMNGEQYALLDEIGYATVDRIASLTTVAVERLSGIFGVPESEIREHWIPDAQKAVFSPEFNRS